MRKLKGLLTLLLLMLVVSACSTPAPIVRPVEIQPPKLPPVPADVMVAREPNFRQRLLDFFSASPTMLTP